MGREPSEWVRVRRHAKAAGLYVFIDVETLQRAKVPLDAAGRAGDLLVRRYPYGTDVLLRFRRFTPSEADLVTERVTRRRGARP